MNRIRTANTLRIPVRWFTSHLHLIPVRKPPVRLLTTNDWLQSEKHPDLAAVTDICRQPIVTNELAI